MRSERGVNRGWIGRETAEGAEGGGRGFAWEWWRWYCPSMKSAIDPELLKNPLFIELMEEGLAIQHQFSADPIYARTGKGYLKPTGVAELQKIKSAKRAKRG